MDPVVKKYGDSCPLDWHVPKICDYQTVRNELRNSGHCATTLRDGPTIDSLEPNQGGEFKPVQKWGYADL